MSAVPLLYNGQEVGRSSLLPFFTGDPIAWSANQDMLQQYEKFMSIYNETQAFKNGALQYFNNPDVVVFTRTFEEDQYLIVVNVRNASKEVTLDASLQNTSWTDKLNDTTVSLEDKLTLPPYGYMILKK
jgi:beta-galactosidase GanA